MWNTSWRAVLVACALLSVLLSISQFKTPPAPAYTLLSSQFPDLPHAGDGLLDLNCTQLILRNGLRVVLREEHVLPQVVVDLRYHAGSKDEATGHKGLAHLLEHMMFQPTRAYSWSGSPHGATGADSTHYASVGASDQLPFVLKVEAYRMASLPAIMSQERFDQQRAVVLSEKREREDTSPYGLANSTLAALIYPPAHPYHWPTSGLAPDLAVASLRDVQDFAHRFYCPNNASLAVVGDFKTAQVIPLIEQVFGAIPSGPRLVRSPIPTPHLARSLRSVLVAKVGLPRLYMAWQTVPEQAADAVPLDLLTHILAHGAENRLERDLIYQRQLAREVQVYHLTQELAGQFQIIVTARPGLATTPTAALYKLEVAIRDELANLTNSPPSVAEMTRAKNQLEMQLVAQLETAHERADALNSYALFEGDSQRLRAHLLRYQQVTSADLQRVARTYLDTSCVVLDVIPAAPETAPKSRLAANHNLPAPNSPVAPDPAAKLPGAPAGGNAANEGRVWAAPAIHFKLPPCTRYRLANGLRVVVLEQHQLPLIAAVLAVRAGGGADPPGQGGLAHLTAKMLDQGTTTRSALQVAAAFDALGARFDGFADRDATCFRLSALQPRFDAALAVLADVILHPIFAAPEWERQRRLSQAWFAQRRADPRVLAPLLLGQLLFSPNAAFGHSLLGDATSLRHIELGDLRRFYNLYYHPQNAVLVVAGDVQPATLHARLAQAFGAWPSAPSMPLRNTSLAQSPPAIPSRCPNQPTLYLVDRPGAMQSLITIGQPGVTMTDARQLPLDLVSRVLGGGLGSRLNNQLRETMGYTYGVQALSESGRDSGLWSVATAVQATSTAPALETILRDLRAVREDAPVTRVELSKARWSEMQGFPQTMETAHGLAWQVANQEVYALPHDYYDTYLEQVSAVSQQEAQQAVAQVLDPARMKIVVIGDRKVIESALRQLPEVGPTLTLLPG